MKEFNAKAGEWVVDGHLPESMLVVIARYEGLWPDSEEEGGYVDRYTYDNEWFNVPDSVKITGWMHGHTFLDVDDEGNDIHVDETKYSVGEWIDASILPPENKKVITIFRGFHPRRGSGGYIAAHIENGRWKGLPPGITVDRWMFDPDTI